MCSWKHGCTRDTNIARLIAGRVAPAASDFVAHPGGLRGIIK